MNVNVQSEVKERREMDGYFSNLVYKFNTVRGHLTGGGEYFD